MSIAATVVDVKEFCCRIVSNRVCIQQQFHGRKQGVTCGLEDFQLPGLPVRHVQMIQVFAVKDRMGFFDATNGVNQFPALQIQYQYGLVALRRSEQPIVLDIDGKVIEIPFNVREQLEGLHEFQRSGVLSPPPDSEYRDQHSQDQKPFLHRLSLQKQIEFSSIQIARGDSAAQCERHHVAACQSIIHPPSRELKSRLISI